MKAEIESLLGAMGFEQHAVLAPSSETRNLWVVRIRTTRGWFYLREKSGNPDIIGAVERWASKYEAAP